VALVSPDGLADQLITPAEDGIQAAIDMENEEFARSEAGFDSAHNQAFIVMLGGMVGALGLSILIGWMLARLIAAPTQSMAHAMRRLAEGDKEIEIPAIGRGDEIGGMADAVAVFKQAAIERERLEAEAAESRRAAEEQRQRAEAERER